MAVRCCSRKRTACEVVREAPLVSGGIIHDLEHEELRVDDDVDDAGLDLLLDGFAAKSTVVTLSESLKYDPRGL